MPSVSKILSAVIVLVCSIVVAGETTPPKPLFKDFMGICGHTVVFKPELYNKVCRHVRDYHPLDWDTGEESNYQLQFPMARNKVDWNQLYGNWNKNGFIVDVSIMFESLKQDKWKDVLADAKAYGLAFAKYFGPSNKNLVASAEIGNEPGSWDDASYRKMFEGMARGLREGDPKLTVVTCSAVPGKSHRYAKSLTCMEGLNELYDVINVHTYAQAEPWPTFKRSYPEDPKIRYLKEIEEAVAWRDQHATGKPIWITEFGWDCSTKPNNPTGAFSKWIGNTELEQAQWLVRSFMVFSKMSVERAYIYFFNDKDEPQMHGSAGLTRNFKPKMSYYSVGHLYRTLGDYRFNRVVEEKAGEVCVYEFTRGEDLSSKIWAVWSPTGSKRKAEVTLKLENAKIVKAEQMPTAEGDAPALQLAAKDDGSVTVPVDESPLFIFLQNK